MEELKQKLLEKEIEGVITYHEESIKGQLHLVATLKILAVFFGAGLFLALFQAVRSLDGDYLDEIDYTLPIVVIFVLGFLLLTGLFKLLLSYYDAIFRTRLLISDYRRLRMLILYEPQSHDSILYALTNDIFEMNTRGNKQVDVAEKSSGFKMKFGDR